MVRSFSGISKNYFKSGMFFVDVVATIPYELIFHGYYNLILFRLLRLSRLPQTLKLLDISKINKFLQNIFYNNTRDQRVIISFLLVNIYRVFKLILTAIIITYFLGCLWYFLSDQVNSDRVSITFVSTFGIEDGYMNVTIKEDENDYLSKRYNITMPIAS
jgi:hypothetical protein